MRKPTVEILLLILILGLLLIVVCKFVAPYLSWIQEIGIKWGGK